MVFPPVMQQVSPFCATTDLPKVIFMSPDTHRNHSFKVTQITFLISTLQMSHPIPLCYANLHESILDFYKMVSMGENSAPQAGLQAPSPREPS